MKSRLDRVKDWPAIAKQGKFQLRQIARILECSERNLRRYIRERFSASAKHWLDDLRAQSAKEDLARGEALKNASSNAGFAHLSSLTRFMKRLTGSTPQDLLFQIPVAEKDKSCPQKITSGRFR